MVVRHLLRLRFRHQPVDHLAGVIVSLESGCFGCGRSYLLPEEWIAEEKLMPGALKGYHYAEDPKP
jgi:hypothetical protein